MQKRTFYQANVNDKPRMFFILDTDQNKAEDTSLTMIYVPSSECCSGLSYSVQEWEEKHIYDTINEDEGTKQDIFKLDLEDEALEQNDRHSSTLWYVVNNGVVKAIYLIQSNEDKTWTKGIEIKLFADKVQVTQKDMKSKDEIELSEGDLLFTCYGRMDFMAMMQNRVIVGNELLDLECGAISKEEYLEQELDRRQFLEGELIKK